MNRSATTEQSNVVSNSVKEVPYLTFPNRQKRAAHSLYLTGLHDTRKTLKSLVTGMSIFFAGIAREFYLS